MANNSDYTKPRLNLVDLVPQRQRTDVNRSLFETTFNRYLTKTELARTVGSIGRLSNGSQSDQIVEDGPHRQAFQLQPLVYKRIGTVDHVASYKDLLRELELLGVDPSRLPKWGNTEAFNFAPPIDIDKLINYSNYYWYDPSNPTSTPQYITVRSPCAVATALYKQKESEIAALGDLHIIAVSLANNSITVANNVTEAMQPGVTIDITGSTGNDDLWTVQSSTLDGTNTVVVLEEPLNDGSTTGTVTFDSFLRQLNIDVNCFCNHSVGWDSVAWDDTENGVLWDSLTQCETQQLSAQSWIDDNFWVHRKDLTDNQISISTRASYPIIEYLNTVQFNEWSQTRHVWFHRATINDPWVETTTQPSIAEIFSDVSTKTINPSFHMLWSYLRTEQPVPIDTQSTNPSVTRLRASVLDPNLVLITSDRQTYSFPATQCNVALSGTDSIRVYVDGVRQYGTYIETYAPQVVSGYTGSFVCGVVFFEQLAPDADVFIDINPAAASDINYDAVPVRTSVADSYNVELRNITSYRKTEQVKRKGQHSYPQFDIFNLDGSYAGYTSPVFTYKHSSSAPVNTQTGLRIQTETSSTLPRFEQFLVDEDNGRMKMYIDSSSITESNPNGYQTIWRTGEVGGNYVPRFVDANNREDGDLFTDVNGNPTTAQVDASNGDWEVAAQLLFNVEHENRKEVSFTDLVAHFTSMVNAHPLPHGFFETPSLAARLYYTPEYGAGGTIKEYNDSYDLLVSSLFVNNSNPISVLQFAGTEYDTAVNTIKELIRQNSVEYLLNDSDEYMSDLVTQIIEDVITTYELNDVSNRIYGDSGSYNEDTDQGIRNWIASLPMLKLAFKQTPVLLEDDDLGLFELRHHDGHISNFKLNQTTIKNINKAVVNTSLSTTRKRGWTPTAPADGGSPVPSSFSTIEYTRLLKNDYWLDSNGIDLYRFEVVAIQGSSPSVVNFTVGSYWLRSTDGQLFQLTDAGTLEWVPVGVPGDHSPAWALVDLNTIVREVIFEIENRLYDVAPNVDELAWTKNDYILDAEDQELYETLLEEAFNDYVRSRQITDPYAVDYDPSNPFTWNYKDVEVSSPSVHFPNVKDVTKWGSRWYGIYENVFGTPYPHLEPWKLQGYIEKPSWWDEEYAGTSRRWSTTMWNNIKAGVIPAGRPLPETTPPVYSFVCVNTTDNTTSDGYGPDALLPPYWEPSSSPASPEDLAVENEVFIRDSFLVSAADRDARYAFGDLGPVEWEWRKSATYLYDQLRIAFRMQPVRFMHHTWGINLIERGGLSIDLDSERVYTHQNTIFHGDVIDNDTFVSQGINQWFINFNRYRGNDAKNSDFRPLWVDWSPRMAYQFGTFIDPRSLNISTPQFTFDNHDYDVITKVSRGFKTAYQDSLKVSVLNYGSFITRRNTKIPKGEGHDWTFTVTSPLPLSTQYSYYGTKNFEFEVTNLITGLMTSQNAVRFETGDPVTIDSTDLLPEPLQENTTYYFVKVTNNTFKLARSESDAMNGINTITFTDTGAGILHVQQIKSTFFARGGANTAINWHHHAIDKSNVNTVLFPIQITGVQALIDLVDGFVEYQRDNNFIFNHEDAREVDPDTSQLLGWQTEIERMIDTIYNGLGLNNVPARYRGQLYMFEVDPVTDIITTLGTPFQFDEGQEVYMFATGSTPTGLMMNTPYYVIPVDVNRFQLASTYQNAIDGIKIDITSFGFGNQFLGVFNLENVQLEQYVEVNAFRNNLWFSPEDGIVSDVLSGPFPDYRTERVLYDQYGRALAPDVVRVFREDKLTRIYALEGITNDVVPNNNAYNYLHIGGIHLFVDAYEHTLLLNNYTVDDILIYDPFLGVYITTYEVRFDGQQAKTRRPSVGGFFNYGDDIIRNPEGHAEDIQTFYDTYGLRERTNYLDHSRDLLGYTNPEYFDLINASDKTKFIFWKGLIQQKGSVNAVNAFINSKRFLDARVDEFWAYRFTNYGDNRERTVLELRVDVDDVVGSDIRYHFSNVPEKSFIGVTLDDPERWVDLPSVNRAVLPNMYFDVDRTPELKTINTSTDRYVIMSAPYSHVRVFDTTTGNEITSSFTCVNTNVLLYTGTVDIAGDYLFEGINVGRQYHSPSKLIDTNSGSVIELSVWDPAKGHHNEQALRVVDIVNDSDPVHFVNKEQPAESLWTTDSVGRVWWDTSKVGYVPYSDTTLYNSLSKQLSDWGRLADWADIVLYEWTESTVPPEEFDAKAATEAGNTSIPASQRYSGVAKKSYFFGGDLVNEAELHLDFYVLEGLPTASPLSHFDNTSRVSVYVNGKFVEQTTYGSIDLNEYRDRDHIHIVRDIKDNVGVLDSGYTEAYDYISVDRYAANGIDVETVYYFWVRGKTVRKGTLPLSLAQAEVELKLPSVPYMMFRKFEPETSLSPDRFTQILLRNVPSVVTANDRFTLQIPRDFTFRDHRVDGVDYQLITPSSAFDYDTIRHPVFEEWKLFRQNDDAVIDDVLWNKLTEAVVGYTLDTYNTADRVPIPSVQRVVYDRTFSTTTRFGLESTQAFGDRDSLVQTIIDTIAEAEFDPSPINKREFFDTHTFSTASSSKEAMDFIFNNFPTKAVNDLFFNCLHDALAVKLDYKDIMKTSMVTIYGIKLLDTADSQ